MRFNTAAEQAGFACCWPPLGLMQDPRWPDLSHWLEPTEPSVSWRWPFTFLLPSDAVFCVSPSCFSYWLARRVCSWARSSLLPDCVQVRPKKIQVYLRNEVDGGSVASFNFMSHFFFQMVRCTQSTEAYYRKMWGNVPEKKQTNKKKTPQSEKLTQMRIFFNECQHPEPPFQSFFFCVPQGQLASLTW